MLENISLIQEANKFTPITQAEQSAIKYLKKFNLETIAHLRINQCLPREIFYTQFIRALMNETAVIVIVLPFQMISDLKHQEQMFNNLIALCEYHHTITGYYVSINIIDTKINQHHYKDCPCHTIK